MQIQDEIPIHPIFFVNPFVLNFKLKSFDCKSTVPLFLVPLTQLEPVCKQCSRIFHNAPSTRHQFETRIYSLRKSPCNHLYMNRLFYIFLYKIHLFFMSIVIFNGKWITSEWYSFKCKSIVSLAFWNARTHFHCSLTRVLK